MMMKKKNKRISIRLLLHILVILSIGHFLLTSAENDFKFRLPDVINRYQPALVPVLAPDGRYLYFDRQYHPENEGGLKDNDDIWFSTKLDDKSWSEPKRMNGLNTLYSDVLFSISPDGRTALVYHGANLESNTGGFYIYELINGELKNGKLLNIKNYYNKSKNFYGHLAYDGKMLLLSLERDDSFGGLDIYISNLDEQKNEWSEPQNLGSTINSAGVEGAPFLAWDGVTLYFVSDGRKGYGKLDIYMSRRLDNTWLNWSEPINFSENINTPFDENSIWLTPLSDTAFIVSYDNFSKRAGIYYILMPENLKPLPYVFVEGKILSSSEYRQVTEIEISRANIIENSMLKLETKNENYALVLKPNYIYNLHFTSPNKQDTGFRLDLSNVSHIKRIQADIKFRDDTKMKKLMGKVYFQYDSDNPQDLIKYIDAINFEIKSGRIKGILLVGHTDERGSVEYNNILSKRRAENTAKFFRERIGKDLPLQIDWRGSSEPISENHNENRRVEIYLLY